MTPELCVVKSPVQSREMKLSLLTFRLWLKRLAQLQSGAFTTGTWMQSVISGCVTSVYLLLSCWENSYFRWAEQRRLWIDCVQAIYCGEWFRKVLLRCYSLGLACLWNVILSSRFLFLLVMNETLSIFLSMKSLFSPSTFSTNSLAIRMKKALTQIFLCRLPV